MTTSPSVVESRFHRERPDHVGGGSNFSNQVFPMPSAESRRRRNLPALFFRSRHCSVLLPATTAPLSATTLLRTTTLATTTLDLRTAPLSAAALELRAATLSAAALELHTTTLAVAALNPDIATTSVDLNFATATTSAV